VARKLDEDIAWHRNQIARLNAAIANGDAGKALPKGPAWGPKSGNADVLPATLLGMRRQLEHFEYRLQTLEEQLGQGG
jgi:hypothetical protein